MSPGLMIMEMNRVASQFFVAGGALKLDVPSYVKRPADDKLFDLASAGEFCYVLSGRQMGKSSLKVRTIERLEVVGVSTASIDLNSIGAEVSAEQWYLGLITRLNRELKLSVDLQAWWAERNYLGPVQCFTEFLHDVVLTQIEGPVVIFIDEIDTTLKLDFSDDFFAAIRACYNERASDHVYNRLTFVLLGVAIPADLIKDRSRTPFNIGQGIEVSDFSREDAQILRDGLKAVCLEEGDAIFQRVFAWTDGHPYLTQKLCLSVTERGDCGWTPEGVDKLVDRHFLSDEAHAEINLKSVQERILSFPESQPEELLRTYKEVYRGKRVKDDAQSLSQNRLKLAGLVKAEDGFLRTRNEIYRQAFNLDWIKDNTPVDWNRRGFIVASALLVLLVTILAVVALWWTSPDARANRLIKEFDNTDASHRRYESLAELLNLGLPDYKDEALERFDKLKNAEKIKLFQSVDAQAAGDQLIVLVESRYTQLANNPENNLLLSEMARSLEESNHRKAFELQLEIQEWVDEGRRNYSLGNYEVAVGRYTAAIHLNEKNPDTNPAGIYLDRGLAYADLNDPKKALADFEQVVQLDPTQQNRVAAIVRNDSNLYDTAVTDPDVHPTLVALIPTSTPTGTPTPTSTPTPMPTQAIAVVSATHAEIPASTSTSTPTPTASPSRTPTPSPAVTPISSPTAVRYAYVETGRNGTTHQVHIEDGDAGYRLPLFTAAPAWSSDGKHLAFVAEPGIDSTGVDWAEGEGIYIVDIKDDGEPEYRKLFPSDGMPQDEAALRDHINNLAWSLDPDLDEGKIAFEVWLPNDFYEVWVIDSRDGNKIGGPFPGRQPAWRKRDKGDDSDSLVINRYCAPDCGLWQADFLGGIEGQFTNDRGDRYPAVSPDGTLLAYASVLESGFSDIYVLDLEDAGSDPIRLTELGTATAPAFGPDGKAVFFRYEFGGDEYLMSVGLEDGTYQTVQSRIGKSEKPGLARPAIASAE